MPPGWVRAGEPRGTWSRALGAEWGWLLRTPSATKQKSWGIAPVADAVPS